MRFFQFILLWVMAGGFAQDSIRIQGTLLNNTRFAKVVVQQFAVGSFPIAAVPIQNQDFSINAPKNIPTGIYRFQYGQTNPNEYIDIIIDGLENEINFTLDIQKNELPVFEKSALNKQWYHYKKQAFAQENKIQLLHQFLQFYPKTEAIYAKVLQEYETQKDKFIEKRNLFVKNNNNWAGWAVSNTPTYFPDPKSHPKIQDFEKREHYWDNINTQNPTLLNSPIYVELILEYLSYYMDAEMKFSEQEVTQGFKKSVDTIMQKFSGNPETQQFALDYLTLGFKEIGQEEILQYLDENYRAKAQCNDENQAKTEFEKRMAGYAAMKEGNKAPNIIFDKKNDLKDLYSLKAEQTLIVFWASWCPHCMEEMPKLNEWAKNNPNTKVIAISLDEDKTAYETAIQPFNNLLHSCDFKKWNGKAVKDYYVYGTPTFILLDKDKKIVGKYSSFSQVKK